nr:YnhF family membrane protein [Thaumasiovibrio occultus]
MSSDAKLALVIVATALGTILAFGLIAVGN